MKAKKIGYITIAVGITIAFGVVSSLNSAEKNHEFVFRVTLAEPDLYTDGIYFDSFEMPKGQYQVYFIPNGDSPQTLRVTINGPSFSFDEDFVLEGNLQKTGISEYYTWDYLGSNNFWNSEDQHVEIKIDPKGNLIVPVSVEIIPI